MRSFQVAYFFRTTAATNTAWTSQTALKSIIVEVVAARFLLLARLADMNLLAQNDSLGLQLKPHRLVEG